MASRRSQFSAFGQNVRLQYECGLTCQETQSAIGRSADPEEPTGGKPLLLMPAGRHGATTRRRLDQGAVPETSTKSSGSPESGMPKTTVPFVTSGNFPPARFPEPSAFTAIDPGLGTLGTVPVDCDATV
jgi:hypothetical protein